MPDEREDVKVGAAIPKERLSRIRNSWVISTLGKSLVKNPFHGDVGVARAALAASLLNIATVCLFSYQNYYQKKATDRLWSAQQIAVIYDEDCSFEADGAPMTCQFKASNRSRENAVRAYVDVEGHGGTARLTDAKLAGMSFAGVDFSYVDFSGSRFRDTILTGADLTGATLEGVELKNATLLDADLRDAIMTGAYLEGANLEGADLRGAHLERAVFGACDTPVVDYGPFESYTAAHLNGADLRGAVITGASLCEADVSDADLTDVIGLDKIDLKRTRGSKGTKTSKGIKRPERWSKGKGVKATVSSGQKKTGPVENPVQKDSQPPQ